MDKQRLFFSMGRFLSPLYSLAMDLRFRMYAAGRLRRYTLDVPVVSIGNITWGGTGKTPTVISLARFAAGLGLRPVVISRGYGGISKKKINVVSDGKAVLMPVTQAGDEPVLVAESLPGIPVLTGKKRVMPARRAVRRFRPDLILLDDGFQHLALERDLDIVLLSCKEPFGNGRVFPGGQLREPLSALARADCFVATGCPGETSVAFRSLASRLLTSFPAIPLFSSSFQPVSLFRHHNGTTEPVEKIAGQRVFAFCGLAGPDSFRRSLEEAGMTVAGFRSFPDHYAYRQTDVALLEKAFSASRATLLITTEKDYVKIRSLRWSLPLAVVRGEAVFDAALLRYLDSRLRSLVRK